MGFTLREDMQNLEETLRKVSFSDGLYELILSNI
jgi:hypothetical protein